MTTASRKGTALVTGASTGIDGADAGRGAGDQGGSVRGGGHWEGSFFERVDDQAEGTVQPPPRARQAATAARAAPAWAWTSWSEAVSRSRSASRTSIRLTAPLA